MHFWLNVDTVRYTSNFMFDVVNLGSILAYYNHTKRYVKLYGPSTWHLIYQADVTMRLEASERTWRISEAAIIWL